MDAIHSPQGSVANDVGGGCLGADSAAEGCKSDSLVQDTKSISFSVGAVNSGFKCRSYLSPAMTLNPNWTELIARLEFDLQARIDEQTATTDEEAWQTMAAVLWSRARILTFSHSQLQSADVQDLVQNVLLKLQSMTTMRRVRAARSIEGYLVVMLRNSANDLIRRRQLERKLFRSFEEETTYERTVSQPKYVKAAEDASVLGDALESLHAYDRKLLQMRFWRNLSIADIAAETGVSYSATAVRLFRILYRLRVQLKK